MTEWLALPPPGGSDVGVYAWIAALGDSARLVRGDCTWIEVPALKIRGFVVLEGDVVEAINFELTAANALPALESAASALGWELHPDDGEDDD